jgi:manganese transport protein
VKKILELFLGILTAMGGFVEVGEATFAINAGSQFGYSLLWLVAIGTLGIMVFCEMAGRVAAVKHQGVFGVVREHVGLQVGLLTLIAANLVCLLTCAAEIGAIAMLWQLLGGWPYRLLLVLVLAFLVLSVWWLPFEWIERVFGLGGLLMLAFALAAARLTPDWNELASGFVPHLPAFHTRHEAVLFAYFAVALFSSIMLPYETYFYAAGAIEDKWKPADVNLNRAIVVVGFALGSLLSVVMIVIGKEFFGPREIQAMLPGTALLAAAGNGGDTLVWVGLIGLFFAFAGAGIETCLSSAYNLSQYFGWPWGKHRSPRQASRFSAAWLLTFAGATAIVMTGVDPIKVVEYSIVFSVVILPLTYLPLLLVADDKAVMGRYANGWLSRPLGWAWFALSCLAALAAIPLLIATHGGNG